MFKIDQIEMKKDGNFYLDIWVLNTVVSDEVRNKLRGLESKKGVKCCWTDDNANLSLKRYFNGFARIIEYADYTNKGTTPEYAYKLTEGQIEQGEPHGFGRVISGYGDGELKFGYFQDSVHYKTEQGARTDEASEEPKDDEYYTKLA